MNCLRVNKLTTPITPAVSGEGWGVIENAAEGFTVPKHRSTVQEVRREE